MRQDAHGNADDASTFLSGCLEAQATAAAAASGDSAASSPDSTSPLEPHEARDTVAASSKHDPGSVGHVGGSAQRLSLHAPADGFSSTEEMILNSGGLSSGPETDNEDVFASWDRLLQNGGHGSSPVSAVAVVQACPRS